MLVKLSAILLLLTFSIAWVDGHSFYFGYCPTVPPLKNFNMTKFLGSWHVIQKFATYSPCWTYTFVRNDTMDSLAIIQTREHGVLANRVEGWLDVPDSNNTAFMRARFPMSIGGKADFVVFDTDYDNFGAIYTCQSILFGHRRSVSILSRNPTLDNKTIDEIYGKLKSYGIDTHDFSIINQTNCSNASSASQRVVNDSTANTRSNSKATGGLEYVATVEAVTQSTVPEKDASMNNDIPHDPNEDVEIIPIGWKTTKKPSIIYIKPTN